MFHRILASLAIGLFIPLARVPDAAATAFFTGLGVQYVRGVSSDGSAAAGGFVEAYRWSSTGGVVPLGHLPTGVINFATGISGDGEVVVGWDSVSDGEFAVRWGDEGVLALAPGQAYAVSTDGSVIVGTFVSAIHPGGLEAFRWTAEEGAVGLGYIQGQNESYAYGVSPDGSIVVGGGNGRAFRWTQAEGMVEIGELPGGTFGATAFDVSADGSVIVGWSYSASGREAFRWTSGEGMVALGDLPGGDFYSTANAVSADGKRIVGTGVSATGQEALVWDPSHGMRRLSDVLEQNYGVDLTGWRLYDAVAISDDGRVIAGWGRNPAGLQDSWIAVLHVPEPQSRALMALGLMAWLLLRLARGRPDRFAITVASRPPAALAPSPPPP